MSKKLSILGNQAVVDINGNITYNLVSNNLLEVELGGTIPKGRLRFYAMVKSGVFSPIQMHATMSLLDDQGNVLARENMKFTTHGKSAEYWANIPGWSEGGDELPSGSPGPSGPALKGITLFYGNTGASVGTDIDATVEHASVVWPTSQFGADTNTKHPSLSFDIAPDKFGAIGRMELELYGKADMQVIILCRAIGAQGHHPDQYRVSSLDSVDFTSPADNIPGQPFKLTVQGSGAVKISIPIKVETV